MLIFSDTSDSKVSEVSEPYIQKLKNVFAARPSRGTSSTGMVIRSKAKKEN